MLNTNLLTNSSPSTPTLRTHYPSSTTSVIILGIGGWVWLWLPKFLPGWLLGLELELLNNKLFVKLGLLPPPPIPPAPASLWSGDNSGILNLLLLGANGSDVNVLLEDEDKEEEEGGRSEEEEEGELFPEASFSRNSIHSVENVYILS